MLLRFLKENQKKTVHNIAPKVPYHQLKLNLNVKPPEPNGLKP